MPRGHHGSRRSKCSTSDVCQYLRAVASADALGDRKRSFALSSNPRRDVSQHENQQNRSKQGSSRREKTDQRDHKSRRSAAEGHTTKNAREDRESDRYEEG